MLGNSFEYWLHATSYYHREKIKEGKIDTEIVA